MRVSVQRSVLLLSLGVAVFGAVLFYAAGRWMAGVAYEHAQAALSERAESLALSAPGRSTWPTTRPWPMSRTPRSPASTAACSSWPPASRACSNSSLHSYRREGANQWVAVVALRAACSRRPA